MDSPHAGWYNESRNAQPNRDRRADPGMFILLLALLLIAVLTASWVLTLLGMPGNWLMVLATAVLRLRLSPAGSMPRWVGKSSSP